MVVLSRRGWAAVGVGLTGAAPRFLEGLAVGCGSLALLVAGLCFAGALIIDHVNFSRPGIALWGLRWAFAFLIVGLAEELILRGYIFRTLLRGLNFWWAAALTSVWFMTFHIHNDGETAMGLAGVTLFGAICALSVLRSGTISWAVGYHFAWGWGETFMFGLSNSGRPAADALMASSASGPVWLSGGLAGPEGSVLIAPVLLMTGAVILQTMKGNKAG